MERDDALVQAAVIREALKHQGYVTRDRVYKVGRYDEGRMLRGFTRPVNRIVKDMKTTGDLPRHAADLLRPSYQDGVQADGFQVPAPLGRLLE